MLGGVLNDKFGFRRTCDILGCGSFSFLVLYILYNLIRFLRKKKIRIYTEKKDIVIENLDEGEITRRRRLRNNP